MDKRSFTLMEILLVMVAMGVILTLSIPFNQGLIENSKSVYCETNLKALKGAMDIYAMEYDTMPVNLSELPPKYIGKAYAQLMRQKGAWKAKLACFLVESEKRGFVYAAKFTDHLTNGNINLITCPKDATPPSEGGVSYGFNLALVNMPSREYRALSQDFALIADCDGPTLETGNYAYRHKNLSGNYAQEAVKGSANLPTEGEHRGKWIKRIYRH